MKHCNVNACLDCAIAAARAAGTHARTHQDGPKQTDHVYAHDVKLRLDRECQEKAEEVIRSRFPDHAVLGEEFSDAQTDDPWQWIVDPIDGTVNYFHGLPWWCSSVAVAFEGRILAGAVYIPPLDHLYSATSDGPALRNGKEITCSQRREMSGAMIATSFSQHSPEPTPAPAMVLALNESVQKIRMTGSAAIDICHVASGAIDGYFESSIFLWDVAAAGLIAERAGASTERVEEFETHRFSYLACSPGLRDPIRKIYTTVWEEARAPGCINPSRLS